MGLLADTIDKVRGYDMQSWDTAKNRLDNLAIPHWSLGRLQDLALQLAAITGSQHPAVGRRVVVTCAGDHGIVEEGVSAFPKEVTVEMVHNFLRGGASINALSKASGTDVLIADFGVDHDFGGVEGLIDKKVVRSTKNFLCEAAMTREQAVRAIEGGIEIVQDNFERYDVFATGDMGIGNTTPSTAICSVICEVCPCEVTGRGTGIDDRALNKKSRVISEAIELHKPDKNDAVDVLAKVGGLEIGGIAGVILGAAAKRRPVVVDGFISTAGALIASTLAPETRKYMISAHNSVEPGHRKMLDYLGLEPLLGLNMRLGEGTGGAVAMPLLDAAAAVLADIMTFSEAVVSEKNR